MASTIIKILDSNQCYPNTYSETTVKNPPTQITFSLLFLLFFRLYVYSRWFRCVCVCLCTACLPASLIMHVPISELHVQCLHFSIGMNWLDRNQDN
jgi:hypothetical protein